MQSLTHNSPAAPDEPFDLASEVARLESLLAERQIAFTTLQAELLEFKTRYAQIVGCRLAELADVEQAIREAEARLEGGDVEAGEEVGAEAGAGTNVGLRAVEKLNSGGGMRKLFWSVARLFHPDHAADEGEARRRHQIMVEASRAYREGDADSLHTLLGDQDLQFYCAGGRDTDGNPEDLNARLFLLKEELRTIEFGIKRLTQDGMYRIKSASEKEAAAGRDALAEEAQRIARQIVKARHRLTNLV